MENFDIILMTVGNLIIGLGFVIWHIKRSGGFKKWLKKWIYVSYFIFVVLTTLFILMRSVYN